MRVSFRPNQRPSSASVQAGAIRGLCRRIGIGGRATKRRDWLLLFAAYRGAPDGLDPIRFQKGLFLFAQRAQVPARSKYTFEPYAYGPMSKGVLAGLGRKDPEMTLIAALLCSDGLILGSDSQETRGARGHRLARSTQKVYEPRPGFLLAWAGPQDVAQASPCASRAQSASRPAPTVWRSKLASTQSSPSFARTPPSRRGATTSNC